MHVFTITSCVEDYIIQPTLFACIANSVGCIGMAGLE